MLRAYKYRIYPTEEQKVFFAKTFGSVRVVYNWALDLKKKRYEEQKETVRYTELSRLLTVEFKKEHEWLKEVNAQSLQSSLRHLDTAYQNFFSRKASYPKFKSKHDRQSFHNPQHCFVDFKNGLLTIPKVKGIKIRLHRKFRGDRIHNVIISKNRDGRYYASILVDTYEAPVPVSPVTSETTIGIDMGLHTFAVCSNGEVFDAPHFLKKEQKKLKHLSRMLSKKQKGSKRFEKTKTSIARVHAKIARKRTDNIHKITYWLTHENQVQTICVEDLDVRQMSRNKLLSYDVADAGIGQFLETLRYKCEWYGINYIKIGRDAPSSQRCYDCGHIYDALKMGARKWCCPVCGAKHDRDLNASKNIRYYGLMQTLPAERRDVKPADCPLVDDRPCALKSNDRMNREKGGDLGVPEAPMSLA